MKLNLSSGLERCGLALEPGACRDLERFLSELLRWNRQINLTAITDLEEATEKHLIDSLLLLPFMGETRTLLDMGSGAGLPGIPLRIARSDLEVVSVDSVGKKINFQRHIKRLLGLDGFLPVHARLQDLGERLPEKSCFDLVTARAFASLETIALLAAPWLSSGGRVLAMKGPEGEAEAIAAQQVIAECGLRVETVHKYRLPFSAAERQVVVLSPTIV